MLSTQRYVFVCVLLLWFCSAATAGKFGRTLDIGKPAPTWKALPGVDGKPHSLDDLKASEVVVVVFTCNSCPYAVDYEDRIVAFAKRYCAPTVDTKEPKEKQKQVSGEQKKVARVSLVAMNVNKVDEDLLPAMKQRAEKKKFPFPYLFDETQQIAKDYGAIWTPEFFVLNKERKVVYMGALDDNTDSKKVKHHYLEDAVQALLQGKEVKTAETPAIGCQIRWERRRRSKKRKSKVAK